MDEGLQLAIVIALGMALIFGVGSFFDGKEKKQRCYDLSREPSQVSLCKELFGDK